MKIKISSSSKETDVIEFDLENDKPLDDFLGLSPDQMHDIFYELLEDLEHILTFNSSFDPSELENVLVVKKAKQLLKLIGDAGETKATKRGFLPQKIVHALCDGEGLYPGRKVQSEDYVPLLLAVRLTLADCGWLKKRAGRFSLTKKGEDIVQNGFSTLHYVTLLKHWISPFNWAFADGLPECKIVQESSIFLLYLLLKRGQECLFFKDLLELFIRAFPFSLEDVASETEGNPRRTIEVILYLRFVKRFAEHFGLIECTIDEQLPYPENHQMMKIKTTKLFAEVFRWFPPEKQRPAPAPIRLVRTKDTGIDIIH